MSKKESQWFSHDSTASNDPKLIALVAAMGMEGYGRWWRLLEMLRAEETYKYCITTRFAYSVLAKELLMTTDEAKAFVADCIEEFQLLQTDGGYIWSDSLLQRMEHLDKKRASYSERGKKGAEAAHSKTEAKPKKSLAKPTEAIDIAQAQPKKNQANNITVKENKEQQKNADLLDDFKAKALEDEIHFVYPLVSAGRVTQGQLADWLTAFNRLLACRGEEPKSPQDYRRHFVNWFKFRDPVREDPKTFLLGSKTPVNPISDFLKTPVQIEAEQQRKREEWKFKLRDGTMAQ